MQIEALAPGLTEHEEGYWTAPATAEISYPVDGHEILGNIENDSFWFRHRAACVTAAVAQHPPAGPIFDIGGGTGYLAAHLTNAGIPTIVVEPRAAGARRAWERGVRPVVQATTQDAGFLEGSLPALGLFDVVEHIEDDVSFMSHGHDLLTAGGMVYVTVPAHSWLWSSQDVRAGHYRRYTEQSLRSLLERAGFRVDYLTQFFRPLPVPILLMRTLPTRLGLHKDRNHPTGARDHTRGSGWMTALRDRAFAPEVDVVLRGGRMSLGSSILAVATRLE